MSTLGQSPPPERRTGGSASVLDGDRRVKIDAPTLITVSALAWATANVFHEIVGHAGAAVVLGIPVRAVSSTTAVIDFKEIESAAQLRIIAGAATPVNVVTGALALAALRWLNVKSTPMRYYLWLFASISFVMGTWNMITVPLLGGACSRGPGGPSSSRFPRLPMPDRPRTSLAVHSGSSAAGSR